MNNIILIGYGYWGKIWEKTILKNNKCKLIGIVDPILKNNDISDFDLDSYNIVVIVCPIKYHFNNCKFFMENNKKILIEKPCCESLEDIKKLQLIKIENNFNKIFSVGYVLVYNNCIQKIKNIYLHSKKNNKESKFINAYFFRSNGNSRVRKDCDIIYDLLCHDIAVALYIFNCDINKIDILYVEKNYKTINCIIKFEECICHFYCSSIDKEKMSYFKFVECEPGKNSYIYNDVTKEYKINNEIKEINNELSLDSELEMFINDDCDGITDLNFAEKIHIILLNISLFKEIN